MYQGIHRRAVKLRNYFDSVGPYGKRRDRATRRSAGPAPTRAVRPVNVGRSPSECAETLDIGWRAGQYGCRTEKRTDPLAYAGHARVSTIDQDPALQLDALALAECAKICEDHASNAWADRAELQSAPGYVRDGDALIGWKLDRSGRSLPHPVETVGATEKLDAGFRSLTQGIDTTTPAWRLVFHLFSALGQFERDLVQKRPHAGLARAAARGRRGGRKPIVVSEDLERARATVAKGLTVREGRHPLESCQDRFARGVTCRKRQTLTRCACPVTESAACS